MLDKPAFPDETLLACLQAQSDPAIRQVEFLPLGADNHTAVYRAWVPVRDGLFRPPAQRRVRSVDFDYSAI